MVGISGRFSVLLTAGAEADLEALHGYLCEFESLARANAVLDRLMEVVDSLSRYPERGSHPKELVALGMREFRQTTFKPHRIVYRVIGDDVVIHLIADGRRDMQSLLSRRLLGA